MIEQNKDYYYECPNTGVQMCYDIKHSNILIQFRGMCFTLNRRQYMDFFNEEVVRNSSSITPVIYVYEIMPMARQSIISYVVNKWMSVGKGRGITDKKITIV